MASRQKMRQWVTDQQSIEHLKQQTVQIPQPGPDEVLVKIYAVSLNYRDTQGMLRHAGPRLTCQ